MSTAEDAFPPDVSRLFLPRTPRARQAANEPELELRQMARTWWNFFCALTREGFTEHQAILLIGTMANPHGKGDTPG